MNDFSTALNYHDRETKADYVFDKYRRILKGKILDVGADKMYLKTRIQDNNGTYLGVGYGEAVDRVINLDASPLPFENESFDTVLCLDVLEHLESIHFMFYELCRVSKSHVIISLPNPYHSFISMLLYGDYAPGKGMKFYHLPPEPPEDRHRWFFSEKEALNFMTINSDKNGFDIFHSDCTKTGSVFGGDGIKSRIIRYLLRKVFRKDIEELVSHDTFWFVLKRKQ